MHAVNDYYNKMRDFSFCCYKTLPSFKHAFQFLSMSCGRMEMDDHQSHW